MTSESDRFRDLAGKLVRVPKSEADKEAKKYEKKRRSRPRKTVPTSASKQS